MAGKIKRYDISADVIIEMLQAGSKEYRYEITEGALPADAILMQVKRDNDWESGSPKVICLYFWSESFPFMDWEQTIFAEKLSIKRTYSPVKSSRFMDDILGTITIQSTNIDLADRPATGLDITRIIDRLYEIEQELKKIKSIIISK